MKINYIYHSGFLIETKDFNMIIDYYKDPENICERVLNSDKKLYILVSHGHDDHFTRKIIDFKKKNENIKYILSFDVRDKWDYEKGIYLNPYEEYKDENLYIKSYGSTDEGISFYIEMEDKKIFHAGDLNNWHWEEESTKEETMEYERNYHNELNIINKDIKSLDIVFFPVDKRLGKNYYRGAEEFINKIKTDLFVPMHFQEDFEKANGFKEVANKYGVKFFEINKDGESVEYN